ncbi:MAG TPA: phosphoribosylformylglycinamidine cyclo-ligase [Kofleriaceae bacterium]|nr:phosphoribosylformylglycinamidine cyclo-ligase [Kofleriaceae bacterium]
MTSGSRWTYKDAGVDIDAGERLVERIRPLAARATRPEVLAGVGGFAGLCALPARYRDPVLVSGTDGVGTKIKSALATGRHDTIGVDLVAMSVNDVAVTGAEPLFFLDYFATSRLEVAVAEAVVRGVAEGCREAGCALLGGETAEMPGMYAEGEYDLAGFCVGVVERDQVRDGRLLQEGDALIGLHSSGLHSNGHSLARMILLDALGHTYDDRPPALGGASVADELLRPTRIYVAALRALAAAGVTWKAAAHITGGGLVDNPPRMLSRASELAIELELGSWPVPPVFSLIAGAGVADDEMRRTFNLGLGMLVAVAPDQAERALGALAASGQPASRVGAVTRRTGGAPAVSFRT